MRIRYRKDSCQMDLDYVEVLHRNWRAVQILSASGKPMVIQKISNPSDWDDTFKLGTWNRVQSLITGKTMGFWFDHVQLNALVLAMAILLAIGVLVPRRWHQGEQRQKLVVDEDALLSTDSRAHRCSMLRYQSSRWANRNRMMDVLCTSRKGRWR
jgi:hypothetical protein